MQQQVVHIETAAARNIRPFRLQYPAKPAVSELEARHDIRLTGLQGVIYHTDQRIFALRRQSRIVELRLLHTVAPEGAEHIAGYNLDTGLAGHIRRQSPPGIGRTEYIPCGTAYHITAGRRRRPEIVRFHGGFHRRGTGNVRSYLLRSRTNTPQIFHRRDIMPVGGNDARRREGLASTDTFAVYGNRSYALGGPTVVGQIHRLAAGEDDSRGKGGDMDKLFHIPIF